MAIITSTFGLLGQDSVTPRRVQLVSTDNLAAITAAGYLTQQGINPDFIYTTDIFDTIYSYNVATQTGTYIELLPTIVNGVITLNAASSTIVLPTIANHIATYINTEGGLSEDPATAISGGNIQAGLSGTAGYLASFPSTASKGSLHVTGVANTGNTITTISNAAMGQASVISIPDPATATSNFIIADSAGTQHITTGSLEVDVGNLLAGSSGHAGTLSSFPSTAAKGSLILAAVNNTGNTNTTISNVAMGQASVVSIPDPANAVGRFVVGATATPFVSGNFPAASGTGGLMVDSGAAPGSFANLTASNIFSGSGQITLAKVSAAESANAVTASGNAGFITTSSLTTAGGANYAITWTNTKITSTSVIHLSIQGGSNNATQNITFTCVPGSGTATLTIFNNTAATALNGTIIIGYTVL